MSEKNVHLVPFAGVRVYSNKEVGTIVLSKDPYIRRTEEGTEIGESWGIYPVTILQARYGGTYEGGFPWLAFPVSPDDLGHEFWWGWQGGDIDCAHWWARAEEEKWPIGRGDSPCEAYDNLVARVKAMAGVDDREDIIKAAEYYDTHDTADMPADEVEIVEMTVGEWRTALDNELAKLGCSLEELEEMARTGDFPGPAHRALWLMIKPIPEPGDDDD